MRSCGRKMMRVHSGVAVDSTTRTAAAAAAAAGSHCYTREKDVQRSAKCSTIHSTYCPRPQPLHFCARGGDNNFSIIPCIMTGPATRTHTPIVRETLRLLRSALAINAASGLLVRNCKLTKHRSLGFYRIFRRLIWSHMKSSMISPLSVIV